VLPPEHVARLALPLATALEGRIVAAPERHAGRAVLLVAAEAVGRGAARRPASGLVRLAVRRPARRWRYGERLRVETTLRRPRNFANPGGFDYVGHLARQGVRVTASLWNGEMLERLPGRARGCRARLERWRERLGVAMATAVAPPEGAVLRALIVGDEEGIDAELRAAFTRAGVVHVLSISGLHVGLVAAAGFALARWLLGRSERLLLRVDLERLAAALSLGPVALYTALAGLGVATLRSAVMVAAAVVAALLGRRADVLRTLALAALLLGLAWPGAPLEIAFQLSFASVAAIVCGMRRLAPAEPDRSWRARLRSAALVSPCPWSARRRSPPFTFTRCRWWAWSRTRSPSPSSAPRSSSSVSPARSWSRSRRGPPRRSSARRGSCSGRVSGWCIRSRARPGRRSTFPSRACSSSRSSTCFSPPCCGGRGGARGRSPSWRSRACSPTSGRGCTSGASPSACG